MYRKLLLSLFIISACAVCTFGQKKQELTSPDGNIRITIRAGEQLSYDITYQHELLLKHCRLGMQVNGKDLGTRPKLKTATRKSIKEVLNPSVPYKFSTIKNEYNRLLLKFSANYSVEFRAYNDGVAYRFITHSRGDAEVANETLSINFPEDYLLHVQQTGGFKTSYEESYKHLKSSEWKEDNRLATLPVLIDTRKDYKILISESSLTDYPATFFKSTGSGLYAVHPKQPVEFGEDGDRSLKLLREADYIAKTSGSRSFPWRYFVISTEDGSLIENTMTARLAEKSLITDTSWIKPGITTWEWWNGATPYGPDVHFVAGCNTETYKYFIDFASRYGIPYVLLDEGWAQSTRDPYTPNPHLDLQELIRYGKQKNVDIILWLTWLTVENNFDLFATYEQWGVKGVKIDFMDRSDQWMVNYYERVARKAAEHHLFVDFHGSFKPAGLEYKYPNVLSYEGVRGMEQMGGCHPDNSIFFPFIRNAVGPMDFTPGAMLNYQPESYRADRPNSGSIGTRAYQMALFVLFETGIQMMADNPTLYYQNDECARFMAGVPLTTDETISLAAKVGEYAIVVKRKGNKWYIGGITNNQQKERTFDLSLDFLEDGTDYRMTSFEDGSNADRQAMHYYRRETPVKKGRTIRVKMARNGGFAAVIEAEKTTAYWQKMAEGMSQALIKHFWGANFKGYEDRYYFNYGSDLSNMTTNHYWPQAHAMDVIVDAYMRTGSNRYLDMYHLWWKGAPKFNFSGRPEDPWWNVFVDDMEWIALAQIRMYESTRDTKYLKKAMQMYDDWIWSTWGPEDEAPWYGGITWKTDVEKSKNACSNGPAALIAARLHNFCDAADATAKKQKQAYLEQAIKIYSWEKKHLFDPLTGAVYDNMTRDGKIAKMVFTYNIGTFLGAAHELYKITGDKQYLADAVKASNYVTDHLSNNGGVLSDAPDGDGGLFHGIFFRYFVKLINEPVLDSASRTKFRAYITHCATVMAEQGVNPHTMLYGGRWRKAPADHENVALTPHLTGCMLMEAMCVMQ